MYYCESCMLLSEQPTCVRCARKRLREPHAGDFCFVDEQAQMWAEMLCDVLRQNGIPCISRSVLGAGLAMKVGVNLDRHRVFVPFEQHEQALEIVNELFHQAKPRK